MEIGESGAGKPRSKFAASPTPATPMADRDNAMRDASAAGAGFVRFDIADTAPDTSAMVCVVFVAAIFARVGDFRSASVSLNDGSLVDFARATVDAVGCALL